MQAVSVGLFLFSMTWAAPNLKTENEHREPKTGWGKCHKLNEDGSSGGNQGNIHLASVKPEPTVGKGTEGGRDAPLHLPDQNRQGATLLRNITQPVKSLVTGTEVQSDRNKEKKPQSVLSVIPTDVHNANDYSEDTENQQRDLLLQNSPGQSKHTPRARRSTHYLTHLPQIRKILSDFEDSASPDLLVRGDNDVPPFSGDGQHFMHTPDRGGAVGSDPESSAGHPVSGSSNVEIVDPHTNGLGSNEIPGREGHIGGAYATRGKTAQGAGSADVSLVEGSNEITGSTKFRELPGKEGNRVDASSQNAHQGKVEFHYPQAPSKEKVKGGSREHTGKAGYNEIPKSSKGGTSKDAEESKGNQVTLTESQRFPGKGKGQSSHSLGNEVKSEEDSSNSLSREGIAIAHRRTSHPTRNRGMSQRRGSWPSRRPHPHRRVSTRQRDSSESSSSGSSSESSGD
uniref:Matrix extracellular phosphoglycoprotein n=1 Tax=Rattus norvegicus TaxID=10116 RepID=A0A4X0UXX8_RAT